MEPDNRDDARQAWESEYDQWCNEQVDAAEINRLLNEAANVDE